MRTNNIYCLLFLYDSFLLLLNGIQLHSIYPNIFYQNTGGQGVLAFPCLILYYCLCSLSLSFNGTVSEAVTVQVGHAETLLPLLTLLEMFKDDTPLSSTNFANQQNRIFRSGNIVPYTANLLVVLYQCPEGIRMGVRLNEKSLTLPGLTEPVPLYEDVKNRYRALLEGCDQETVCKMNNS